MGFSSRSQFIPFLDYDLEIRRVLCSTKAIESLNARYRRAPSAPRGHFPDGSPAVNATNVRGGDALPRGGGGGRLMW